MKTFNLNNYILVEITEYRFECLRKDEFITESYIKYCILPYKEIVEGKEYYKLQAHHVMNLFGKHMIMSWPTPILPNILIP